jgi:hypothetical protein
MKPQLLRVGQSQSPVVIIDDFSGALEQVRSLADDLAPYPAIKGNYYPGLRRVIDESDGPAFSYVRSTCEKVAPFLGGGFGVDSFDLQEASFSLVTFRPEQLQPVQKAPHFDVPEQNVFALLHYLRVPPGSGTGFYRHRATGIERVTAENVSVFVGVARHEMPVIGSGSGYINGSDRFYEQIAMVDAIPDRIVIYHASLLHSGVIPDGMSFSADPREGRLTANFFLKS